MVPLSISSPELKSLSPLKSFSTKQDAAIHELAKESFFPTQRHPEDLQRAIALREFDKINGDIIMISSEKKQFQASSICLEVFAQSNFFKANWSSNGKVFSFKEISSKTLNLYLDIHYWIDSPSFVITLKELLELFYFADFLGDKKTFKQTQRILLHLFKRGFTPIHKAGMSVVNTPFAERMATLILETIKEDPELFHALTIKEAADNGDPQAVFDLARKFYYGIGYLKNVERAIELYKLAAEKGHSEACFELGEYFFQQKNNEQMIRYYKMASHLGHEKAKSVLSHLFSNTLFASQQTVIDADLGDCVCQRLLGLHYYYVKKDQKLAAKYFIMAANQGDLVAYQYLTERLSMVDQKGKFYLKIKNTFWETLKKGKPYHLEPFTEF